MKKQKSEGKLLDTIHGPSDLKALPREEIPQLIAEIRNDLITCTEKNGGHLASNLGVVELTVALHRVFSSPTDHIIFDVGHQSYVHKLLTGRADRFDTLRQVGGLSGFTKSDESEHDPFGAGHSSTALSAALGFAAADKLAGKEAYSIAVVGDGAFTGGMVHEALNNCQNDLPIIIVLNENEMSISKNTGAFARYMARVRSSRTYLATKKNTVSFLKKLPLIGEPLYRGIRKFLLGIKPALTRHNYFEDLGLLYIGPVDGNDFGKVTAVLERAKRRHGPVLVHLKTEKGHGYAPAVEASSAYHNISPEKCDKTFHAVFGEELCRMAQENERICAITAAMSLGCGLEDFRAAFPDRFFDVGIAEEHATTFSAGLAANGMCPCFAVYSTFLQRAYDNVLHDVALQRLPVKFFIDRAGLAPHDGPTHHGVFDVSFLSSIPEMEIYAPSCFGALRAAMHEAISSNKPTAVRYSNQGEDTRIAPLFYPKGDFDRIGVRADFDAKKKNVIVTYGRMASVALDAKAESGKDVGILLLEKLNPYPDVAKEILPHLEKDTNVIFLEEGIGRGGAAHELLYELEGLLPFRLCATVLAINDRFISPSSPCDIFHYAGIGKEDVIAALQ